jgi:hypothetical protein
MTTLDEILAELVKPVEEYIQSNREFVEYQQLQEAQAAKAAAAAAKAAEEPQEAVKSVDTASAEVDAPKPTFTFGSVDDAIAATAALTPPPPTAEESIGYIQQASMAAKGLFFNFLLTTAKVSEAGTFVGVFNQAKAKSLVFAKGEESSKRDESQRSAITVKFVETVSTRLRELQQITENEHSMAKLVLKDHNHNSGRYEAMLRVIIDTLTWMLQPTNLNTLCICLRYEESKVENAILPQTKELISFLTGRMLALHLDDARDKEKEKLNYQRVMQEKDSESIIRDVIFVVDELDLYNWRINNPTHRLNNAIVTIGYMLDQNKALAASLVGYGVLGPLNPIQNGFMGPFVDKLTTMSEEAKKEQAANVRQVLSQKLVAQ